MENFSLKSWGTWNNRSWTKWPLVIFSNLIYYGSVHPHQTRLSECLKFWVFSCWTEDLGLTFISSKPSWKDMYWDRVQQQLIVPSQQLSSSLLFSQRTHHILNAFCACGGEKASISSWPNEKVLSHKIPPSLIIPLSATKGSGHSLDNATCIFNSFEYFAHSDTSLSSPKDCLPPTQSLLSQ